MANEKLARRYASAVYALAVDAQAVERIGNDLAAMDRAIGEDDLTRSFYVAPVIDRKVKERVLLTAFEGKVHEVALHTLLLLVRKRRESLLDELVQEYRKLEMQARGTEPLTVTSARELPPAELQSLVDRLQRAYQKKFDVTLRIDPSLIGGVRIMMGDRRIDGSVAGRLEELARTLFASN
jgi:F-type H+-transporting ATPase subunit delta